MRQPMLRIYACEGGSYFMRRGSFRQLAGKIDSCHRCLLESPTLFLPEE